jgi:hypothetical protein
VAADTYVSPANPALNFGNLGTISVGPGATSANTGLIQFDLTCLAGTAQANIGKATLTVYVNKALVAGGLDFAQIALPWTESTVTYNTKPAAYAAFATNAPVTASGMYVTVDVTSVVQHWVSGIAYSGIGPANYGIQVTAAAAAPTTSVVLDSKESTTTSQPARLDIALVTASYMSGLVGWIPSYQGCSQGGSSCQEQTLFMVNLTAGQTVTLDFYTSTSGPGSVYHAYISKQPGPSGTAIDYSVIVNLAQGTGTPYQATVSPSVPLYSTGSDPTCQANPASCPVNAVIKLMSDSLLTLQTNSAAFPVALNEDITDSIGAIKSAQALPTAAHTNTMKVVIWNAGTYQADFIVSVSQCTTGIFPVAAQSQTLNAGQTAPLNFVLYSSSLFISSNNQCTVTLSSPDGKIYDSTVVQFE